MGVYKTSQWYIKASNLYLKNLYRKLGPYFTDVYCIIFMLATADRNSNVTFALWSEQTNSYRLAIATNGGSDVGSPSVLVRRA